MFDQPLPNGPDDELTPDDKVQAIIDADARRREILAGAEHELKRRESRRLADALERKDERKPVWVSLTEELRLPDDEEKYSIDRLLPLGGNALFAGQYKAGKTTFNGQLIKAWADAEHGAKFCGEFECFPDPDRPNVTFFNYEMSQGQMRRWLRSVGVINTDRVNVVNLRGMHTPFGLPEERATLARQLADSGTGLWVIDPASRAFAGAGDISSNSDVTAWLAFLDEIKMEANVRDLVLNIHMPHGAKDGDTRAIGAQAWSAWADALWFLIKETKNGVDTRWFRADGRDVYLDRMRVLYEDATRSVMLMEGDADAYELKKRQEAILDILRNEPGIATGKLKSRIGGNAAAATELIDQMVSDGMIAVREMGRGKKEHYLPGHLPTLSPGMGGTIKPGDPDHDPEP